LVLTFELTSLVQVLGVFFFLIPMWSSLYWVLFKPLILAWYWVQDRFLAGMRHIRNLVHTIEFDIRQVSIYYICDSTSGPYHVGTQVEMASAHTSLVGPLIPKFG
jgi:hypothetical protein